MGDSTKPTIAYFNQTLSESWASLPWIGAVKEAREQNINLLAFHGGAINDETGLNQQGNIIYDLARGGQIDGLISWKGNLTLKLSEQEVLEFMESYNVPVITIEGALERFPCVTYGNYEGMKTNVGHLTAVHGFTRIAYLGLIENHTGYNERYRGYRDGLADAGIELDRDLVRPWVPWIAEVDGRSSNSLLDSWLNECFARGVEGIIGACDPIAVWIIERLNDMGKRVPDDISVCGFDGFDEYQRLVTPLTTVDPGWENVGRIAVQKMVDILEGRPTEMRIEVPARPRIAKSCGCLEENVVAAKDVKTRRILGVGGRKSCLSHISRVISQIPGVRHQPVSREIIDRFYTDVARKRDNHFVRYFDSLVNTTSENDINLNIWQEVITHLQTNVHRMFRTRSKLSRAYSLCNQARIAITNSLQRQKDREIDELENRVLTEQSIGMELITTFDLEELGDRLAGHLEPLRITSCYMAIYDNPQRYQYPDPAPEWATIILAYKDNEVVHLSESEKRIRSQSLLPRRFISESTIGSFCVYPLAFREQQIGYIVYESNLQDDSTYSFISSQISNALQGTLLIRRIDRHSKELEHGIEGMSTAIEQMARNIEAINDNVSNQSGAVTEEATAIEEMRSNIARISELSGTTADISGSLDTAAQSGAVSVRELVATMEEIQHKSGNISKLSALIQGIADQTKLLAFNAAVEAVHAGERGRGFSIVAKEIRKLAEDTENNVQNINIELNTLLNAIADSGNLTSQTMDKLDNIISNSAQANDLTRQLSLAMKEQDMGTNEILHTTQGLVSITSEISQSMQEQMVVTNEFKSTLLKLRELV